MMTKMIESPNTSMQTHGRCVTAANRQYVGLTRRDNIHGIDVLVPV